jgi:tetratricopeptide (TPR) repeat protein
LSDHIVPAVLSRFFQGEASKEESRAVVAHLLTGCPLCLTPAATLPPPALEAGPADAYDLAIQRAFAAVSLHGARAPWIKEEARRVLARFESRPPDARAVEREDPVAALEALLTRSWSLRHGDPPGMVHHAWLAVGAARRIRDGYDERQRADFHARALGELANALRVADELDEAGQALDAADEVYATGTRSAELGLRLQDVRASLLGVRELFPEACALFAEVHRGQLALGDRHGAARALLGQGFYTGLAGETAEAFRLFDEALALIDESCEPHLRVIALHNKLLFLVNAGRLAEALGFLARHRDWLWEAGGPVDRTKLQGIEGRIHSGLGHAKVAEAAFRKTRQGFAAAGMAGHEALITLDLASAVMRQGHTGEATDLATEALQVFDRLKIGDRVSEALHLLAEALRAGLLTAGLLESVAEFVRRAEHDRKARYQPRFD